MGTFSYENEEDSISPWYRETLYRKRTGEYFLFGESYNGCCRYYGGEIIPYTLNEAKQWAEWHCDGDEYVGIFDKVEK